MPDTAREYNANFAVQYAQLKYSIIQKAVDGNPLAYVESLVQLHLNRQAIPKAALNHAEVGEIGG
jgi:hypothetical protein